MEMTGMLVFLLLAFACLPVEILGSECTDDDLQGAVQRRIEATRLDDDSNIERRVRRKLLSVLIVSPPGHGHLFKAAAVGGALARRGHNVTVCTTGRDDFDREKFAAEAGMHFISAGRDPYTYSEFLKIHSVFDQSTFGLEIIRYFSTMVKPAVEQLSKHNNHWDVVIVDWLFYPAIACHMKHYKWDRPLIVAESTSKVTPPWPSPSHLTTHNDNLTFLQRFQVAIVRNVFFVMSNWFVGFQLSGLSIDCSPYFSKYYKEPGTLNPVIVYNAFGLEYSQTTLPMTHYIGPVVLSSSKSLPSELGNWLATKEHGSVVYITMGSTAQMTKEMGSAIIDGVLGTNFSALWSLRKENQNILDGRQLDPNRFLISKWLPQQAVLESKAIAMTITHGGMGGITESLYQAIPLIVIPFGKDQPGHAARVASSGTGVYLDKDTLTAERVRRSLETVASPRYKKAAEKLRKIFIQAGGAEKAAELVEFYEEVGYEHLIPAYAKYNWNWVQYYNVDVYIVIIATAITIGFIAFKSCSYACRRCFRKKSKTD